LTRTKTLRFSAILVLLALGWGFTQPMTKLSVSTGYQHFGLIFWQLAIGTVLLGSYCAARGIPLPLRPPHLRLYLIIALVGTIVPNSGSYQAAVHLPAGVISILYSMIPMLAFPIALSLRTERFEWRRLAGLLVGLVAVLLITTPWDSAGIGLAGAAPFWVLVLMVTCLCYAFEGNYVARWGTEGLSAVQVLYGASALGLVLVTPIALLTGQWIDPTPPWGVPDMALIAASVAHVVVYVGYVWLVGQAGPTFAVQISYLVTFAGVFWAQVILGESYPLEVWFALLLMVLGMYMVQPRRATIEA